MILKSYKNIERNDKGESGRINQYTSKKNTRFGIILENLPYVYKSLLKNRWFSRYIADDDEILNIAFHCLDIENDRKSYNKVFYLEHLDRITTKNKIKYFSNIIKWKCSICEAKIEIDTSKKIKHRNLVCENCLEKNVRILDSRVVENYTEFSKFLIDKIKKDHDYLTSKMQKNRGL
jgi:DNA-directed RNA polymerase subunit RPC12/RpoP